MIDDTKKQSKQKDKDEKDGAEPEVLETEEELGEIEKEIVLLQEKNKELEQQVKRVLADYQNAEKRMRDEKSHWVRMANREILLRFLPVLDTLFLATKHSEDKTLQVTLQQFLDVLNSEGIKRIKTDGQTFDPSIMECIDVAEGEENKVLEELRPGFILHDIVLRPAQVKVGKKKAKE